MLRLSSALVTLLASMAVTGLSGCASVSQRLDRQVSASGLDILTLEGNGFHLRAYGQHLDADADELVIYFEGDGRPWIRGQQIATDPHGFETLALDLMRLDPRPALYVERPCYHRILARRDACHPGLWTQERYGETVAASLAAAINDFLASRATDRVTLVGYSGGGVLAMLVAPRLEQPPVQLVTLAANLDVAAWTAHHGYLPLTGSLDPATLPALAEPTQQLHLVGAHDVDVPAAVTRAGLVRQPGAEIVVYPDADHRCCWRDIWPSIVGGLSASNP